MQASSRALHFRMLCLVYWYRTGLTFALFWLSGDQSSVSANIFPNRVYRHVVLLLLFLTYSLTTAEFVNSHLYRSDYTSRDGLKPRPAMQKLRYEILERQDGSDGHQQRTHSM